MIVNKVSAFVEWRHGVMALGGAAHREEMYVGLVRDVCEMLGLPSCRKKYMWIYMCLHIYIYTNAYWGYSCIHAGIHVYCTHSSMHTHTHTERKRERERERDADTQTHRRTHTHTHIHTHTHTHLHTCNCVTHARTAHYKGRQTVMQTEVQIWMQTQVEIQMNRVSRVQHRSPRPRNSKKSACYYIDNMKWL